MSRTGGCTTPPREKCVLSRGSEAGVPLIVGLNALRSWRRRDTLLWSLMYMTMSKRPATRKGVSCPAGGNKGEKGGRGQGGKGVIVNCSERPAFSGTRLLP